jgi:hypothetical protein
VSPDRRPDRPEKEPAPRLPQVGKRPSSPFMLFAIGVVWVGCGVLALTTLTASWKFIPAIFFIGIGFLWLRGAALTFSRHERRSGDSR